MVESSLVVTIISIVDGGSYVGIVASFSFLLLFLQPLSLHILVISSILLVGTGPYFLVFCFC